VTVAQWLEKITELRAIHVRQMVAGEITASQADDEEQELLMRARLDLTDEQASELLKGVLLAHQATANEIIKRGHSVSGNNPHKPN
jgi:hypothetical protein